MRWPIDFVLCCTAFLVLTNLELPAQQSSTRALPLEPASIQPQVTLSPEQKRQLQSVMDRWMLQRQQMAGKTQLENAHSLLDQALTGDQMPSEIKSSFVDLFAPSKKNLHQFLDTLHARLQEQLKKDGPPRAPRSEVEQSMAVARAISHRAGNHDFQTIARRGDAARHSAGNGLLHLTQAGSSENFSGTIDGKDVTATESDGVTEAEVSGEMENGIKVKVKGEDWHDSENWISQGGGLDLGFEGKKHGVSGTINFGNIDGAKVKRCPSESGVVPGKARQQDRFMVTATDSTGTTSQIGSTGFTQTSAEGHVGDDAILKDVKATVTTTLTGKYNSDVYVIRVDGTVTFDPHSEDRPAVQRTGCSSNAGTPSIQDCDLVTRNINLSELKRAYIRAEKKWNFDQGDIAGISIGSPSACVKVKFTPKTKTVRGRPMQSIPVRAEIITIHGEQPTWGRFDELDLWGYQDAKIQENGARTAPGTPAQLTYTAPPQPWPPNKPPGFYVRHMTSRAGAFKWAVYAYELNHDDFLWLLKSGLKLSIHHKWEVKTPLGGLMSEATFPIELMQNERGDLFGQTFVPRTYQQVEGPCKDTGQWNEQWQAYAMLDEKGENLTIKLRFDSGPKQALTVCPPVSKAHTVPGFRSDSVRTPLDQFTMPAEDKATKQFVFDFGGFAKNVVDVKVEEVKGE